jgi:hypothetical protein
VAVCPAGCRNRRLPGRPGGPDPPSTRAVVALALAQQPPGLVWIIPQADAVPLGQPGGEQVLQGRPQRGVVGGCRPDSVRQPHALTPEAGERGRNLAGRHVKFPRRRCLVRQHAAERDEGDHRCADGHDAGRGGSGQRVPGDASGGNQGHRDDDLRRRVAPASARPWLAGWLGWHPAGHGLVSRPVMVSSPGRRLPRRWPARWRRPAWPG